MVCIKIADIVFGIDSDISIRGLKSKKLREFEVQGVPPDIKFQYLLVPELINKPIPLSREETGFFLNRSPLLPENFQSNPLLLSPVVRKCITDYIKNPELVTVECRTDSLVIFDHRMLHIHFFFSKKYHEEMNSFILGPEIFSYFLSHFDSMMVHSSAVVLENKAAIFLAPDEGGKTTAAELSSAFSIICDDQNVIKNQKGVYTVYGTPWGIHRNHSIRSTAGGFFLLEKGKDFDLQKVNQREVFFSLWDEHISSRHNLPKMIRKKNFDLVYELASNIPGYRLTFSKEYIDWEAVRNAMEI